MGIAALALIAGGSFAILQATRNRAPLPPTLASLGPLAPEIEGIVRQARESVVQMPRDGFRWGRFGMVCEANGLAGAARDAYAAATTLQGSEAKWWFRLAAVDARATGCREPRGRKSPFTSAHTGFAHRTTSSRTWFTMFS